METLQVLEVIQTLHLLTSSTIGRLAVVNVLSKGDLLEILVSFSSLHLAGLILFTPIAQPMNRVEIDYKYNFI
jgi:hypothetical protein